MFFKLMLFEFLSTIIKSQNFREVLKFVLYVYYKTIVDNV